MKAQEIQQQLESYNYMDAKVTKIDSKYFGDEVTVVFQNENKEIEMQFLGCSKISFSTTVEDREKPLKFVEDKDLNYNIKKIEVTDCIQDKTILLNCTVDVFPLNLEICCNTISVFKK